MRRVAILAACIGLCATPALAQTKATVQKLNNQFAYGVNTGNAVAVAALYTKDAYLLPPASPIVKGRDAIEKFWKARMSLIQDVQCTALDVKRLGRAALEIGTCSAMTKKAPLKEVDNKFAVVWEKEGGKWKAAANIWNSEK